MVIPDRVAKWAFNVLVRWVLQDKPSGFPFLGVELTADDVESELLDAHFLLSKIPPAILDAIERVSHNASMAVMMSLKSVRDRDEFMYRKGQADGIEKSMKGILKIANLKPDALVKRPRGRRKK